MFYFSAAFSFFLGLIIGSFLNVLVLRYNTGRSVLGKSGCFSCGKKLRAKELFPLLSFFLLGGKCSHCKSKISIQYPLVEFFTGLLFLLTFFILKNFSINLFFYWFVWSLLIVIFVYDIKHKIIPNGLVFLFIALSFVRLLFFPSSSIYLDLITSLSLFSLFAILWLVSSGKWMGFGDAKLVLGIGALLGFEGAFSAIVLSFWIGAIVSLFVIFLRKFFVFGMDSRLPES